MMKITSLTWHVQKFELVEPYTIAYETVTHAWNVFLKLSTNQGLEGYGCAAPDLIITGETPDQVEAELKKNVEPLLLGSDPFRYSKFLEKLEQTLPKSMSLRAAVDMALYDLVAKKCQVPLWKYLGGFRSKIKTSVTIGIMEESATVAKALEFVRKGFKAVKVKGGKDLMEDVAKVQKVREAIGTEIELRFDANQGYTVDQAKLFLAQTKKAKIQIIEQPTPKDEHAMLGLVKQGSEIPIMADESVKGYRDTFRLARNNLMDMVNIKIQKIGGIYEAQQMNAVAHAAKMQSMIGCLDECALAISAGLHFSLSHPNIAFADLDSHFDFVNDPTSGCVRLDDGYLMPTEHPGLGLLALS